MAKLDSGPEESPNIMVGDKKQKQKKIFNNRDLLTKVQVGLHLSSKIGNRKLNFLKLSLFQ